MRMDVDLFAIWDKALTQTEMSTFINITRTTVWNRGYNSTTTLDPIAA